MSNKKKCQLFYKQSIMLSSYINKTENPLYNIYLLLHIKTL